MNTTEETTHAPTSLTADLISAIPTHNATVWDLRAVQAAFYTAGAVASYWHTGPEAGRAVTWQATVMPRFDADLDEWITTVSEPSDGVDESMEMALDFYQTPDKAERHLVHTDLRGVTFVNLDGTPRATYRIPDDAPTPPFTAAQMFAQDKRVYRELARALADLGVVADLADPAAGAWWPCTLTANKTAETGYVLLANWSSAEGVPNTWALRPVDKSDEFDDYSHREWDDTVHDLHLPLMTPVQEIAHVVADWVAINAPDLRTA